MMRVPTIPLVVSSFSLFLSFAWAQPDETRVADPLDGRLAAYFQLGGEQSTWPRESTPRPDTEQALWQRGGHTSSAPALAFTDDGQFMFSGSGNTDTLDDTIKEWRVSDGALLQTVVPRVPGGPGPAIYELLVAPNNCLLSAGTGGVFNVWNLVRDQPDSLHLEFVKMVASTGFFKSDQLVFFPSILALKVRPDGRSLAGGASRFVSLGRTQGIVDFWDIPAECAGTWARNHTIETQGMYAVSADFNVDSTLVATTSGGSDQIEIWDANSGSLHQRVATGASPGRLAYSSDGQTLAVALSTSIPTQYWISLFSTVDYQSYAQLAEARQPFAISPDSRTLFAAAGQNPGARIDEWDLPSAMVVASVALPAGAITGLAVDNSSAYFATDSGPASRHITLWSPDLSQTREISDFASYVYTVAFSPSASMFAAGEESTIFADRVGRAVHLFSASDGSRLGTLEGNTQGITGVVFSPDGTSLASSGYDTTLRIWNLDTGDSRVLNGHTSWVAGLDFSRDGQQLVSAGGRDQWIRLWDVASGVNFASVHNDTLNYSIAFSPDGTSVASGDYDGNIKLWDASTLVPIETLSAPPVVLSVAYSPDGALIASSGGDSAIRLWDVATGQLRNLLTGHRSVVRSVTFSSDGTLASGGFDGTLILWDVSSGTELQRVTDTGGSISAVRFSPDGTQIGYGRGDAAVVMIPNPL